MTLAERQAVEFGVLALLLDFSVVRCGIDGGGNLDIRRELEELSNTPLLLVRGHALTIDCRARCDCAIWLCHSLARQTEPAVVLASVACISSSRFFLRQGDLPVLALNNSGYLGVG
jgi:hypothetical protein